MCPARWPERENALPHVSQTKGFSPVCVRTCKARLPESENALPHVSQTKGFSPECVRMCTARLLDCANALPHVSQTKGFSPECVSMCTARLLGHGKVLAHVSHLFGRSWAGAATSVPFFLGGPPSPHPASFSSEDPCRWRLPVDEPTEVTPRESAPLTPGGQGGWGVSWKTVR